MKTLKLFFTAVMLFTAITTHAQNDLTASAREIDPSKKATAESRRQHKVVAITGVRFVYPLVQKWIDDYNKINPDVQLIIEHRGTTDPAKYDILIEAYELDTEIKKSRDFTYIARYAILPVANSHSAFSNIYSTKGLHQDLIKQLFFHDIFSDKKKIRQSLKLPILCILAYKRLEHLLRFPDTLDISRKILKANPLPVQMNIC